MDDDWMAAAACKGAGPEHFYPADGEPRSPVKVAATARFCSRCTVSVECLAYAIRHGEYGVWAGTLEEDRQRPVRRRYRTRDVRAPRTVLPGGPHGVRWRYVEGCRCWPCTDAERDYRHARRRAGEDLVAWAYEREMAG